MKRLYILSIALVIGAILASCSQQSDNEEIKMTDESLLNETPLKETDSPSKLEDSKLGQMVSSVKLQIVDGQNFKEAAITKVPEYYILYFSASW